MTLSFIGLNTGLFSGDGPQLCGQICFDNLQAPASVYAQVLPSARRINLEDYAALLAPRERTAHKGLYGHLLVIGGDHGMAGAARIAAEAGARVGAGLISVATRNEHAPVFNLTRPELMCHGVDRVEQLLPLLQKADQNQKQRVVVAPLPNPHHKPLPESRSLLPPPSPIPI